MTVGQEIRRRREEKGWSQAKLGVLSGTGPSGISQIETGRRNPSAATLVRIADALEVDVADLFPKAEAPLWSDEQPPRERREPEHQGLVRTYRAAAAFGRTVVESFKNFKPLDMQRLVAFHQLESALRMLAGRRNLSGKSPVDLAEAIDELEEISMLVNERLNEHLDTSPPKEREKFERELRELTEPIRA